MLDALLDSLSTLFVELLFEDVSLLLTLAALLPFDDALESSPPPSPHALTMTAMTAIHNLLIRMYIFFPGIDSIYMEWRMLLTLNRPVIDALQLEELWCDAMRNGC